METQHWGPGGLLPIKELESRQVEFLPCSNYWVLMGRKFRSGTLKVCLDDMSQQILDVTLTSRLTHRYKSRRSEHGFSKRNSFSSLIPMLTKNISFSIQK